MRPSQHEKIRKIRNSKGPIGDIAVRPCFTQCLAIATRDNQRTKKTMWIEAGCEDNTIKFMQSAIHRANATCLDMADFRTYKHGVRLLDRRIKAIRDDQAFATHLVARCQLGPQERVDNSVQIVPASLSHRLIDFLVFT